jgi:hypothetical protein
LQAEGVKFIQAAMPAAARECAFFEITEVDARQTLRTTERIVAE